MTLTPEDLDRIDALAGDSADKLRGWHSLWIHAAPPLDGTQPAIISLLGCDGVSLNALPEDVALVAALDPDTVRELVRLARAGLVAEKHLRLMQERRPVPGPPRKLG